MTQTNIFNDQEFKKLVDGYIQSRIKIIVQEEANKASAEVRRKIEEESLKIGLLVAQKYKVDGHDGVVTISIIKKS